MRPMLNVTVSLLAGAAIWSPAGATALDASRALAIAAGLSAPKPGEVARLDVAGGDSLGKIDIRDAIALLRMGNGLRYNGSVSPLEAFHARLRKSTGEIIVSVIGDSNGFGCGSVLPYPRNGWPGLIAANDALLVGEGGHFITSNYAAGSMGATSDTLWGAAGAAGAAIAIQSITTAATVATVTTAVPHGFVTGANGQTVTISGATGTAPVMAAFNGTKVITVISDTAFTYPISDQHDASAAGTLTYKTIGWIQQTGGLANAALFYLDTKMVGGATQINIPLSRYIDVFYGTFGAGGGGKFWYTLDGAARVEVDTSTADPSTKQNVRLRIDTGFVGLHTLVLTAVTTGTTAPRQVVAIEAIIARQALGTGLTMMNSAVNGAMLTRTWEYNWKYASNIRAIVGQSPGSLEPVPDEIILSLGLNDMMLGVPQADAAAAMSNIVSALIPLHTPILIPQMPRMVSDTAGDYGAGPVYHCPSGPDQDAYNRALCNAALAVVDPATGKPNTYVVIVDCTKALAASGTVTDGEKAGMYDGINEHSRIHFSEAGHIAVANAVMRQTQHPMARSQP